ncbi:MAG: carboxymuconolactone decarboxylase family protein [Planctomycetes bacterium]|nr:carboxymuconolactone decarboxylase family protein [Planctomycetota bacterium]
MAYIRTIAPAEATGALKQLYDAREASAGKVWNIVRLMSLSPGTLRASMGLYAAAMHAPSPLSRALREAIAVVVSQANDCHY